MTSLSTIVEYLDEELRTSEIDDFPGAKNGLQLENSGRIERIVAAVDASLAVIKEAASVPHTLLLVHHGLFWQGANRLVKSEFTKMRTAMNADLAIYSSHLPLDIHPELGNNVLLARALGLQNIKPASLDGKQDSIVTGLWKGSREAFQEIVVKTVDRAVACCFTGPEELQKIAVMTGGGGSQLQKVSAYDPAIDLFLTGEGPHWSYVVAEDIGLNTIYAGHYATETFGVRKLAEILGEKYSLPQVFIDRPGGL